jgi:UDP-glucose:(heptosyl)LPS alpha-1,3-glucosyltransferase
MSTNRILAYVEHFRLAQSGAEEDAVRLFAELARRGWEIHVVAQTAEAVPGVTAHLGLAQIPELRRQLAPCLTVDWGFFAAADVHRLGGGIHEPFLVAALAAYPRFLRWWKQLEFRSRRHRFVIARERAILANPAALVVPISRLVAAQAAAAGVPPDRCRLLYNGVDPDRFDPRRLAEHRLAVRREWGLRADDVACLFVAHNLRLKNLRLLRHVFHGLAVREPRLKLIVIGKRAPGFRAPYLVWAGSTDRMLRFYAAGDLLLHPSFYDSFGNVIIEAMSCGLPVAVSDRCGAAELITRGQDGFVLPVVPVPGEKRPAAQWSELVAWLAADPALRGRIGAAARDTALRHRWTGFVDGFETLLRERAAVSRDDS